MLTGAGQDAFCAGGDLKAAFEGDVVVPSPRRSGRRTSAARRRGSSARRAGPTCYKPTIAAVNGVAYAGGLEWACWTDLCIADEHATFGVTCRRWNIGLGRRRHPAAAADRRVPRGDGADPHRPRDRRARRRARIGLVNEVVPRGTCLARARELAHALAALPQPAMRTDKEAAVRGSGRPLEEGLRIEAECFNRLIDGPEMAEGLRRFNERDHPDRIPGGPGSTPGLSRPRTG